MRAPAEPRFAPLVRRSSCAETSLPPRRSETAASCAATEIDPPTDVLASGAYRRHVATVLTKRSLQIATARAKGEK